MKRKLPIASGRFLAFIFVSWLLIAAQLGCVKQSRRTTSALVQNSSAVVTINRPSDSLINVNTATREQLEKLPGIGQALATRIIEHREKYGRFRRLEHLLLVRGISERRYQALSAFLTVE